MRLTVISSWTLLGTIRNAFAWIPSSSVYPHQYSRAQPLFVLSKDIPVVSNKGKTSSVDPAIETAKSSLFSSSHHTASTSTTTSSTHNKNVTAANVLDTNLPKVDSSARHSTITRDTMMDDKQLDHSELLKDPQSKEDSLSVMNLKADDSETSTTRINIDAMEEPKDIASLDLNSQETDIDDSTAESKMIHEKDLMAEETTSTQNDVNGALEKETPIELANDSKQESDTRTKGAASTITQEEQDSQSTITPPDMSMPSKDITPESNNDTTSKSNQPKDRTVNKDLPSWMDAKGSYMLTMDANASSSDEEQQPSTIINGYSGNSNYNTQMPKKRMAWSAFLSRNKELVDAEANEDGWQDMRQGQQSFLQKSITVPLQVGRKLLPRPTKEPGTLILVRHGESEWNANKTFTGWADPDLSPQGWREVEHAARLLLEGGYELDVVFTSRLKRAIRSTWIILQEMNEVYLPVFKSWRLNERFYGAL
jgi:hypothetical protein